MVDLLECEAGADSNEIEQIGQMYTILANPASHDKQSPDIQGHRVSFTVGPKFWAERKDDRLPLR